MGEGRLVTEVFGYDGGRPVSVYLPREAADSMVLAADGERVSRWVGERLEGADLTATMVVCVHGAADEGGRLAEYSPTIDPPRFAAHERFVLDDVLPWVRDRFGVAPTPARTAAYGASAGGELALALGLRHPEVVGVVLCASPGGGFRPDGALTAPLPRTYLLAGRQEPWFLENATRWADALAAAGAEVVMRERGGEHGGVFWRQRFALMVAWAFEG